MMDVFEPRAIPDSQVSLSQYFASELEHIAKLRQELDAREALVKKAMVQHSCFGWDRL